MWDLIVSVLDHCLSFYFTITTGINQQSMLNLPVKAIAEIIAQQKFCGKINLS